MIYKEAKANPEYQQYHKQVVDECAKLMGEKHREFFDTQCDYMTGFAEKRSPADVAMDQYEAFT